MMLSNRMAQIAQKNFPQGINGRPQQPQAGIGGLIGKMTQAPPQPGQVAGGIGKPLGGGDPKFAALIASLKGGGGSTPMPMQPAQGGLLGRLRGVQPLAQLMGSPQ